MKIINGEKIAFAVRAELKEKMAKLPEKPGLAIILIGDDPGSHTYVRLKEEAAKKIGIHFEKYLFPTTASECDILKKICELNERNDIHGIVVQFPLPAGLRKETVINAIAPEKDVDGFQPDNIELLLAGKPRIIPGMATGIMKLIESTGVDIDGKRAVIIARSRIFIEPLGYLLKQKGTAVSSCDPNVNDCQNISLAADILIVAIGQSMFVKERMVKPGAIVIDVGYNRIRGKIIGDVDFESVKKNAAWITPVPGGVGPMTVAMLLNNVLKAYEIQKS